MKSILETERFYLREFADCDAKDFYEMNLDKEVMRYTGDIPFKSIKEAEDFIKNYLHYKINGFGRWTIVEKGSSNYIGWCGLKKSDTNNEVDIGFRIAKDYWNMGVATETAMAVLNFAFTKLNLTNIVARAMAENSASIRVIEKFGMKFRNKFQDEYGEWLVYDIHKP